MGQRSTVITVDENGGVATFTPALVGVSLTERNHTVAVEDACVSYSVDILVGDRWVRPADCTDVDASDADGLANVVVLRQVGFSQVRVTVGTAGDVTLVSWDEP
jgi:hypothetical protein